MSLTCSICGINCNMCPSFGQMCQGCDSVAGKTFWSDELDGICPIYNCAVNVEHLRSCAYCELLPCELYFTVKDPSIPLEQHKLNIKQRVLNLNNSLKK